MLKITDLFDSKNFVELHDSEMKIIQGGLCIEPFHDGLNFYPVGTVLKQADGHTSKCVDIPGSSAYGVWVLYNGD